MMNRIWLIIILLCYNFCAFAVQKDSLWAQANEAYTQKQYDAAINFYEELLLQEKQNPTLYYNLGNAYYRANKVSDAALNYERALFFNPQLKEAKDNLLLAQNRIPNAIKKQKSIFFIEWWNSLTAAHLAATWAILALVIFILSLTLIFLKRLGKLSFSIPPQTYFIAATLVIVFIVLGVTAAGHASHSNKAVVMTEVAILFPEQKNNKGQKAVPQATTVIIDEVQGNGYTVSLPDKRTGWMKKSDLSRVQPELKK